MDQRTQLIYDPLGRLFETNDGAGGGVTRFLYDGDAGYVAHREKKTNWYNANFPDRLMETLEGSQLSSDANQMIDHLKRR